MKYHTRVKLGKLKLRLKDKLTFDNIMGSILIACLLYIFVWIPLKIPYYMIKEEIEARCLRNATTDIEITMCTGDVDPADPLADEDRWIYVD
jgi:hypothetical protein